MTWLEIALTGGLCLTIFAAIVKTEHHAGEVHDLWSENKELRAYLAALTKQVRKLKGDPDGS